MAKDMSLRIIPFGRFGASHEISVMIVGRGRAMDVRGFSVSDVNAMDQSGRSIRVSLERHPGESSKYGPYVSLVFDAKDAKRSIVVTGKVAYESETYALEARYIQGSPDDTYFWREAKLSLERQN
jgi:hypothetical protein